MGKRIQIVSLLFLLITRAFLTFYYTRRKIDAFIKNQSSSQACKQPNLPVFAPELMKFVRQEGAIDCSHAGDDWVICEVSYVYFLI